MKPFIPEALIDRITDELGGSDQAFLEALEEMKKSQPILTAYLFTEDTEALTNTEREWLLYLAVVIFKAASSQLDYLERVNEETVLKAEELNWELLQQSTANSFHERLNVFFENYTQEDLLAFVEDALVDDDEDGFVTREGREPLFVTLKTVIDVLAV